MKKLIALLLACAVALGLSACKGSPEDTTSEETPHFDYDLAPYVTLGQYKGVSYVPLAIKVTDDAVWDRIVEALDYCGLYAEEVYPDLVEKDITEGQVMYGDLVEMDITLTVEGEVNEDCTVEGFATEIGGNFITGDITEETAEEAKVNYDFLTQFLTGIEKKTVGAPIGDTVTWDGTFPEDNFDNDLTGKSYTLAAKVTKVATRYGHPDTLTDTEAAKMGEFDTFEEYRDAVRSALEEDGYETVDGEVWHFICAGFKSMGYYDTTLYEEYYKENLTEGTVEKGDVVEIAFEGVIDGERYENACSDGYTLEIGSGSFIAGFEDGLIGKPIGESVVLELTFPDPYPNNTDLSGKPVTFTVDIKEVSYRYSHPDVLPDIIMEELYGYGMSPSTKFEDLWQQMYDEEKADQEAKALTQKQVDAWEAIKNNCTLISVPEDELNEYVEEYEAYYTEIATYYGYESLEAYLSMSGSTYETFIETGKELAQEQIFEMMIMYSIARAEGYDKLEESEYEERAEKYVTYYQMDSYEALCEQAGKYTVKEWVMSDMVLEMVTDNAVAKEG